MRELLAVAVICALAGSVVADERRPPAVVTVRVEGVVIGPAKLGGNKWDGGPIAAADLKRFNDTLTKFAVGSGSPYVAGAALISTIGTMAMGFMDKPDAQGAAELYVDSKLVGKRIPLGKVQDSFTPRWAGLVWEHVPLDRDVRLRIELADYDLGKANDIIGNAIVNSADLRRALADGRVFPINVADQTSNQLVAVQVSVMLESRDAPADNEISAVDAAALALFIDNLADAVVATRDDCSKMAASLNILIGRNQDLIARTKAAEASGKKVPKNVQDRMNQRKGELAGAIQTCAADQDVQAAIQRLK